MILVALGTQDKEFIRLPIEIEKLINKGIIQDKVIVQIGNTKFKTNLPKEKMEVIEFTNMNEMTKLIKSADLIITHGGVATIIEGINYGKKIIAVPRLKKYKEHVNDHQVQIIENFDKSGYIIGAFEVEKIEEALEKVENFIPKKYTSNCENFINKLESKIELLCK